ncbi:MAG: biotin--[acetyl-CoA-carboxylase] ligase [Tidjanibacter sp.]|nr:biotin--[acetyl-CoA-carboxylase] ligase [Tidjanibacter sp.]
MAVLIYKSLPSTNTEVKKPGYRHGDVVIAREQTAGRGQRGNRWSSNPGENLTFSLVWEPTFLEAKRQFLLSEAVALALTDTLEHFQIRSRIKWTNDIYVGNKKICGILIEHDLGTDGKLSRTVVGIGLNINQKEFEDWVPNPTSMALIAGHTFDLNEVFQRLYDDLEARYSQLQTAPEEIEAAYDKLIYRKGTLAPYRLPNGKRFEGVILGVKSSGELLVESEGMVVPYLFKEIEFII